MTSPPACLGWQPVRKTSASAAPSAIRKRSSIEWSLKRRSPSLRISSSKNQASFGIRGSARCLRIVGMRRRLNPGLQQRPVEHGANFRDRQRAVHFFAVYEEGGGGVHANDVAFLNRCFYSAIVLPLDAGGKLYRVHAVLLALQHGGPVQESILRVVALLPAYRLLVGVQVVGVIPVGVVILRSQAICIHSCANGPGMNFRQRVVLVYEQDLVAIFLVY